MVASGFLLIILFIIPTSLARLPIPDPCATIAGKRWVLPSQVRDCITSFPLKADIKANIIDVVSKTIAFHTSVNYQIQAPSPYENDVHEDLAADLARMNATNYDSEFDFHLDIYRSFKRANDGHCGVFSKCYDSLFITYLPLPLVLLTEDDGTQNVYVAPEAFNLSSVEFEDSINFWQDSLPGPLKGQLSSLSGAKVIHINGEGPFTAVNENAKVTGSYQSFATRQNAFFSSYSRGSDGWQYTMGNFAQQVHPLIDSVELTLQLRNSTETATFLIPYRSRFGSASKPFTNSETYRANNCLPIKTTNGIDLYGHSPADVIASLREPKAIAYFQQQPPLSPEDYLERHPMNVLLDGAPLTDIDLPERLQPPIVPLTESYDVAQFYLLKDNVTGVLALGSFAAENFTHFGQSLLDGLKRLKADGAKHLIIDVTNNGGGYICIAHWLHRIVIGPKDSTIPQAGLDTTTRAGSLAQLIGQKILEGADPGGLLYYNPLQWTNATHHPFPTDADWLRPHKLDINGHQDAFSQRLGQECQPFRWHEPEHGLFKPEHVVIVSNGRCGSSCSLFSITMAKEEGVKTIVVGGKNDVQQEYCGTVGGQSTDFSTIDTEVKSTKLKDHPLAPPDFLTNSVQGITWRLGYGIDEQEEPEEWQAHFADLNFPLTRETVNNPVAIWEAIALTAFKSSPPSHVLQIQSHYL